MRPVLPFLIMACGLLAIPSSAIAGRLDQTVFATVGWSEWCPPGYVAIDLESGRFEWIAQLSRPECGQAKSRPIVKGELAANELESLRQASELARKSGLVVHKCNPVISNAVGPYILVLGDPQNSLSAPTDLSCWSEGATNLHRRLERLFDRRTRPISQ